MLGGGMRQVGILAAAGIYALDNNIVRLAEDHTNAKWLAAKICDVSGINLDAATVQSNMIYFQTEAPADSFVEELEKRGVLSLAAGPDTIRLVTHMDVNRKDMEYAANAIRKTAISLTENS